ncbi:MAG: cytochrome c [Epsilonproteobacteria bacterium]|nr:MAG: cytochrome c [Campylobacterota bacterium]RLA66776.1 MAG: cytochrome c [Campylobacterota bacterium]
MKWLTLVLLPHSFSSFAQDAKRGEKLYQCHGKNGEGNPKEEAPRISGQFAWYIVTQIKKFLSGDRKNSKMMPYIKKLSGKDINDLAAYILKMTTK